MAARESLTETLGRIFYSMRRSASTPGEKKTRGRVQGLVDRMGPSTGTVRLEIDDCDFGKRCPPYVPLVGNV